MPDQKVANKTACLEYLLKTRNHGTKRRGARIPKGSGGNARA
jgi:hypothetical protein